LGHVTSSYWSANCERSIALALVEAGRDLCGRKLHATTPAGFAEVVVVAPTFLAPGVVAGPVPAIQLAANSSHPTRNAIERRPPLPDADVLRPRALAPETPAIRLPPPRARFSLRVAAPLLPPDREVAGFKLQMPVNRWLTSAAGTATRLGPDEWLLHAAED